MLAVQDVGIYVPERSIPLFKFHFRSLGGTFSDNWAHYNDLDLFKKSNHQKRVACLQVPYPYPTNPKNPKNHPFDQEIADIYNHVDTIVLLCSEVHQATVDFIRRHDLPKMCWFLCGKLNPPLLNGRTYTFLDWFITTIHFYKNVRPTTLYQLNPYESKPLMFDALLGRKKHHRDVAYNFIQEQNLADKGIVTYINTRHIDFQTTTDSQWLWEEEGLTERENVQWTVEPVKYYGHSMSLSQVMPLKVYNQTAYSLVCETNCENDSVFFTEKTVKPILARRLFILVANRYSLAMLRELGFRTFDGIIDESYDEIACEKIRQFAAMEQLKWLCKQPQERILAECRDIVDHNFNLMMCRDWHREFCGTLSHVLFD